MVEQVVIPTKFTGDEKDFVRATTRMQGSMDGLEKEFHDLERQLIKAENQNEKFRKSMQRASANAEKFESNIGALGAKFRTAGAAVGVAATAITGLGVVIGSQVREVDRLSARLGIATETMSRYQGVVNFAGTDLDNFTEAVVELSVRVREGGENTAEALELIGLSLRDLQGLAPDEQFERFAQAVREAENVMDANQAVMEIMGDEAQRLVPAMRLTAEQFERIKAAGPVFTEEDARQVERLAVAWEELKGNVTELGATIAAFFTPAAAQLLETVNGWTESVRELLGLQKQTTEQTKEETEAVKDNSRALRENRENRDELTEAEKKATAEFGEQQIAMGNAIARLDQLQFAQRTYTEAVAENIEQMAREREEAEQFNSTLDLMAEGFDRAADAAGVWGDAVRVVLGSFTGPNGAFSPAQFGANAAGFAQSLLPRNQSTEIGSGIGTLAGASLGLVPGLAPFAPLLAAGGGFVGGGIGSLFGGGQSTPGTAFQQFAPGTFGQRRGAFGQRSVIASSPLAQISIGGRDGAGREPWMQAAADAIAAFDTVFAEIASEDQLAEARQRIAAFNQETSQGAFDLDTILRQRTTALFDVLGGDLEMAFADLTETGKFTGEEMLQIANDLAAVNELLEQGEGIPALPDTITELVDVIEEFRLEGETVAETYSRLSTNLSLFSAGMDRLGRDIDDNALDLITAFEDIGLSMGELASASEIFYTEFFSEEERRVMVLEQAREGQQEFNDAIRELGFEVPTTRDAVKDFVDGLDLTTDAGRRALEVTLDYASALDAVFDHTEERRQQIEADRQNEQITFDSIWAERAGELDDSLEDNTRALNRNTQQIIVSGRTPNQGGSTIFDSVTRRLLGEQFGTTLSSQLRLDADRIQSEMDAIVADLQRQGIYRTPGGRQSFNQRNQFTVGFDLLAEELNRINTQLDTIGLLNQRFPGLGEERFALMREFAPLFDGRQLTDLERALGFEEFNRRWQEIIDRTSEVVVGSLDNAAQTISDYLRGVLLGDQSALTPQEQVDLAQRHFDEVVARAQAGENVDPTLLTGAHSALVGELRSHLGVGPQYIEAFNRATEQLADVGIQFGRAADQTVQVEQLEALRRLVQVMERVDRNTSGLPGTPVAL